MNAEGLLTGSLDAALGRIKVFSIDVAHLKTVEPGLFLVTGSDDSAASFATRLGGALSGSQWWWCSWRTHRRSDSLAAGANGAGLAWPDWF